MVMIVWKMYLNAILSYQSLYPLVFARVEEKRVVIGDAEEHLGGGIPTRWRI